MSAPSSSRIRCEAICCLPSLTPSEGADPVGYPCSHPALLQVPCPCPACRELSQELTAWSSGRPGPLGLELTEGCCAFQSDTGLGTYTVWSHPVDTCRRRDQPSLPGGRVLASERPVWSCEGCGCLPHCSWSSWVKGLVPQGGGREAKKGGVSQQYGTVIWGIGSRRTSSPRGSCIQRGFWE